MTTRPQLDLAARLRETGALLSGHFRLSSGLHSPSYVQCARLLEHPDDARAIGAGLAAALESAGPARVVAPALGGVIIGYTVAEALGVPFVFTERKEGAMTLRRGFRIAEGERVVVVEDVVTTGKSTRETVDVVRGQGGVIAAYGAILNRSGKANPFAPDRFEALMQLELETFEPSVCPLCANEVPLDSPGSRFAAGRA